LASIIHISTADAQGGSAQSARRIHEGLRGAGHVSRMLVGQKSSSDPDVDTVHGGGILRLLDRAAEETTKRVGLQYLFYPSSMRIRRHSWLSDADIIQIYNTHGGYFTHRLLPFLATRAPLVWRLSDMWALTGHCAFPGGCERWRHGCGSCPDTESYPSVAYDTTAWLWRLKQRAYGLARPTIVAPSSWAEEQARASPLFSGLEIKRIPNGVDVATFNPAHREAGRSRLGIAPQETVILFSAQVIDENARKGSGVLVKALNHLGHRPDLSVVLVGEGGEKLERAIPQPVRRVGFVSDRTELAQVYAAADVVAAPSAVENLPNSVLEALACGAPIVACDSGGMRDAVRHDETGWLVPAGDARAFSSGLSQLTQNPLLRRQMGQKGRQLALQEFSFQTEIQLFVDLYSELRADRKWHTA
jgi:glycosyltransferase involved in cell wall biosynthesis